MFARRELITKLEDDFAVFGPISLGIRDEKNSITLAKTLYEHYMDDITFNESHFEQLTQVEYLLSGKIGDALRIFFCTLPSRSMTVAMMNHIFVII